MPAEIMNGHFVSRGHPAWWDLEGIYTFDADEHVSTVDAVTRTHNDFELRKVKYPAISVFGSRVEIPRYAVVRAPTEDDAVPRWLGDVAEDYEILDNAAIARVLEPLGERWPVDTCGSLGQGERFFLTLKSGVHQVAGLKGEEVAHYFAVTAGHNGGHGLQVTQGDIRIVCANTWAAHLDSASLNVSLAHHRGVGDELAVATALIARMEQAGEETVRTLDAMALTRVSQAQIDAIIKQAYPEPREGGKVRLAREAAAAGVSSEGMRQAIQDWELGREALLRRKAMAYESYTRLCEEHPLIAGTAYGAFQAVTAVENYRQGTSAAGTAGSIMFGDRGETMERALRLAVTIAREGGSLEGVSLRRRNGREA